MTPENLKQVLLLRIMEKRLRAMLNVGNPSRNDLRLIKLDLRWVRGARKTGRYQYDHGLKPYGYRTLTAPEYRAGRVDTYCRKVAKGSSIKLAHRLVELAVQS